jgi:hypothetical protein
MVCFKGAATNTQVRPIFRQIRYIIYYVHSRMRQKLELISEIFYRRKYPDLRYKYMLYTCTWYIVRPQSYTVNADLNSFTLHL